MSKKELYIFNNVSPAIQYGIGTYIGQLIEALKNTEWKLNLVYLYAQGSEAQILEKESYRQIIIPCSPENQLKNIQYYAKTVAYILKDIIPKDSGTEYIFHLNFMIDSYFIKCLKKQFRSKFILVCHYTDWSFSLLGDIIKLKKMLQKPRRELKEPLEKIIVKRFKNDIKLIKQVDRMVCIADHTWSVFHKIGAVPSGKTEIINNALKDTYKLLPIKNKSDLRSKYYIDDNTRIIFFSGRLDEVKGVVFLIRAFKSVLTTHQDIHLFIAGDGDFFKQNLKESADCWTKITFTGRLGKKKLYELYQIADIGISCSLHEEFGLVSIEMMMHKLPVIVTKTGGLDEIVEDGISGLKVSVRTIKGKRQVDVKQLEEKIRFLLDNPAYAQNLGENGRKRFLEKFELSLFKEKMLNLYNTL
jgi:glycosyltransferase